jgi:hypothetical protein
VKTRKVRAMVRSGKSVSGLFILALGYSSFAVKPAHAFFDGQTGVITAQIKNACPAFGTGEFKLSDSVSPPGNLPMIDVFEHESGARCSCTRSRTDKSLRCGPTAPVMPGQRAARSG